MPDTPIAIIPEFVEYRFTAAERPGGPDDRGRRWFVLCEPVGDAGPLTHVLTSLVLKDDSQSNAEHVAKLLDSDIAGFHFTTLERRGAVGT